VPTDRDVLEGDVFHEAAQFKDIDDLPLSDRRPMGSVLDQGVEFQIAPQHLPLLREVADQQAKGFIPTGFKEVINENGVLEYKVQGWRQASAEEMNLPLGEITKNLKIVDYGFKDPSGHPVLGKLSLGAHDANDHLRAFRALDDAGLMGKDASGRGYADLLHDLGDFHNKDMFNRESELIASVAYNWRAFSEMHPSYEPPITLNEIAGILESGSGPVTANQREALAYVKSLDPASREAKELRHARPESRLFLPDRGP
jgi:hypothetical protein